ncbi:hypothetical protein ACFLVP_04330, partial [Chloroflexota bacterium]
MIDTVIKNCKVVSPTETRDVGIAIDKGKIVSLDRDDKLPQAKEVIDVGGKHVVPGIIDVHVHCRLFDPHIREVGDMTAAAFGGITTVGIFADLGTESQTKNMETHDKMVDSWEKDAVIDAFFHGSILTETTMDQLRISAQNYGITSFKFFMTRKGEDLLAKGGEPTDDG